MLHKNIYFQDGCRIISLDFLDNSLKKCYFCEKKQIRLNLS